MISLNILKQKLMIEKILNALSEAKNNASGVDGHGKAYITDHTGENNIMRLDVFSAGVLEHMPNGGVIVYGQESKNITSMVEDAIGHKFCNILAINP